jgi:hypothetical protein
MAAKGKAWTRPWTVAWSTLYRDTTEEHWSRLNFTNGRRVRVAQAAATVAFGDFDFTGNWSAGGSACYKRQAEDDGEARVLAPDPCRRPRQRDVAITAYSL